MQATSFGADLQKARSVHACGRPGTAHTRTWRPVGARAVPDARASGVDV